MFQDNRRQITEFEAFKGLDKGDKLIDSKPLVNTSKKAKIYKQISFYFGE